jgi:hypothetical protein
MARPKDTLTLASLDEAIIVLFCLIDDSYRLLNPNRPSHEPLEPLSKPPRSRRSRSSCGKLRGVQSERSFLPDTQRFFSHLLFPGVVGLHPSSLHRRVRKLRRFLEPLHREVLGEPVGEGETLVVGWTLLSLLHPRQVNGQVKQSAGFDGAAWARWGSFAVYG